MCHDANKTKNNVSPLSVLYFQREIRNAEMPSYRFGCRAESIWLPGLETTSAPDEHRPTVDQENENKMTVFRDTTQFLLLPTIGFVRLDGNFICLTIAFLWYGISFKLFRINEND